GDGPMLAEAGRASERGGVETGEHEEVARTGLGEGPDRRSEVLRRVGTAGGHGASVEVVEHRALLPKHPPEAERVALLLAVGEVTGVLDPREEPRRWLPRPLVPGQPLGTGREQTGHRGEAVHQVTGEHRAPPEGDGGPTPSPDGRPRRAPWARPSQRRLSP